MRELNVGVAGAGIGGLTAAALLADRGDRVTVFDRYEAPIPVGSGLVVQRTGRAVLAAVGALERALSLGCLIERMHGSDRGRTVLDVSYGAAEDHGLAIHRAALFAALFEAAQRRPVRFRSGQAIVGREGQRLRLASGALSEPFDLIVDAAGAQSPLSPLRARPLAYGALWGVVDWIDGSGIAPNRLSQRYRGSRRMAGLLPLGRLPDGPAPKAAIFWSLAVREHAAWCAAGIAAWKRDAAAIWPEAMPFFDQIDDAAALTMARYTHGSLRRPFGKGIVHIGDAAHRASPQLGQGANMAMLDALALTRALDACPDVDGALEACAAARRWHVAAYQGMSALFTPQYQSDSDWLPVLRDRILYPLSRIPPLPAILRKLVAGDLLPPIRGLPGRHIR